MIDKPSRRALVTGGSRGIGRSVVLALAADGVDVVAVARTESGLVETAKLAADRGFPVRTLVADLADLDAAETLVGRASELLGAQPSIVVNAAGIVSAGKFTEIAREDWDRCMRVNVQSALIICQTSLPAMVAEKWGRIVNIGSMYSRVAPRYSGVYAISKHALLGMTRLISSEFARSGITANAVLPGWTSTDMLWDEVRSVADRRGIEEAAALKIFLRNQPMGREIESAEVADLVAFLCSDRASTITGQGLNIDGGEIQT